MTVRIIPTLRTGGTSLTNPAGACNPCTRTAASATASSPITGDISYEVIAGAANVVALKIHVDLGVHQAQTNYKAAAPSV